MQRIFITALDSWYLNSGTRVGASYELHISEAGEEFVTRASPDAAIQAAREGAIVIVRRPTRGEYLRFLKKYVDLYNLAPMTEFHVPDDEEQEEEDQAPAASTPVLDFQGFKLGALVEFDGDRIMPGCAQSMPDVLRVINVSSAENPEFLAVKSLVRRTHGGPTTVMYRNAALNQSIKLIFETPSA